MRKIGLLFCVCIVLASCEKQEQTLTQDEIYAKAILGSWVVSKLDKSYGTKGGISTYFDDGTLTHIGYKTGKCEEVVQDLKGHWRIESQQLIIELMSGQNKLTIVDKIELLSGSKMMLKANDGTMLHRSKSSICL
ncbi:MAG: hypothetical protein HWD86_06715 [Kangiellaceae bacterium]|nr:hypothetical protein [Kangiellaceae bacterium]